MTNKKLEKIYEQLALKCDKSEIKMKDFLKFAKEKSKQKKEYVIRYMHPEDHLLFWGGEGKLPKWVKEYLGFDGKDILELNEEQRQKLESMKV